MDLGTDLRDRALRIPSQYKNAHSLTVGGSGSGKTTKSKFDALQVAPLVRGMWLFDFEKEEFPSLKPQLARVGVKLLNVPARKTRLNPLQCPEDVTPPNWAPRTADMLVRTLQLPARATKLLHLVILELYREFGILDGSRCYPTLFDLRERIASDPDANHQAKRAVVDSIDPVLMSIGDVLRYRVGWKTGELAKRHIVFKLGGTSEVDKNLILNSLIVPEFVSRVARGISNPMMDLWICCDEAARLVSSGADVGGIVDLIGLVRGTGIGLDLSTQSADVAAAVLSNTACKYLGRCGSATDYNTMGAAMGLTPEQRQWIIMNLKPGMFVGQLGEGEWRRPFVFKIPKMKLDEVVGDEGQTDDLQDLMALPTEPVQESLRWYSPRKPAAKYRSPAPDPGKDRSDAELRYIQAVINNPGTPSRALPKLARMSPKRAQGIRRRLVELGYLREHSVATGKRGRAAIVLEPLESALQLVREARGEPA